MARRADLESLAEGKTVEGVELSRAEAVALNRTKLVSVQPDAVGWTVTAAYAVGALACGDLRVRVQPKVGSLQVLRLMARAHGVRDLKLDDQSMGMAGDHDLTTVLATLFTAEASTALAAGPLRGYRTEDQTLSVLRGRLRVRDQELRRFGQLVPIDVTVDEWTTDTAENRRLRAATRRLLMLPDLPILVRRRLTHLDRQLADVRLPTPGATIPPWTRTRLNIRLHTLLELADLVLASRSVEHRVGDVTVKGFVLSMPLLFERLVTRLLADATSDVHVAAQQQHRLDEANTVTVKPDLILIKNHMTVAVADVKYKLLDDQGRFPNADAYQLLAYCTRLGLDRGHLIYASGEPQPAPIKIIGSAVRIHTHTLDLRTPLGDLESAAAALVGKLIAVGDRAPVPHAAPVATIGNS